MLKAQKKKIPKNEKTILAQLYSVSPYFASLHTVHVMHGSTLVYIPQTKTAVKVGVLTSTLIVIPLYFRIAGCQPRYLSPGT